MLRTALLFVALIVISATAGSDEISREDEILGLNGELPGGDFTLHSSQGNFSLSQLRGKVVLLYFGYTKCPDVCPTSLAIIAQALNELSGDEGKSVQAVFVSVDPKRDNLQILDRYVSYFHPGMIGVTGSESEIAEVAKLYGVQYEEVAIGESGFGYAVDHSAETYLISPQGDLRFIFPHQTPPFVILEAIRYLLAGNL
jgi:protein SCO1/2